MESVTNRIKRKLGLRVNAIKRKFIRSGNLKYLGFRFWKDRIADQWKVRSYQDLIKNFKKKLKGLTQRKWLVSFTEQLEKLNQVIGGWTNYFSINLIKGVLTEIDLGLRTKLRLIIWNMWKHHQKYNGDYKSWELTKV